MRLRAVNFAPVFTASGVRGFFGEGYWYHPFWKCAGLTFTNCGFIAKTITAQPRAGNMPLKNGVTPWALFPNCVVVKPIRGIVLNSVGLSNAGAHALLNRRIWQNRSGDPWFLSFMAPDGDPLDQMKEFVALLTLHRVHNWRAKVGLEINLSCPNTGSNTDEFTNQAWSLLNIADGLGIPLQVKLNATASIATAYQIAQHPACDALVMSNTIPWGKLPDEIDWKRLFGTTTSPLEQYGYGGGGLSGWPLAPIVCKWIRMAIMQGIRKPIWACGGIDSARAVHDAFEAGAEGVQIGTAAMLRPWRMRSIIRAAWKHRSWK